MSMSSNGGGSSSSFARVPVVTKNRIRSFISLVWLLVTFLGSHCFLSLPSIACAPFRNPHPYSKLNVLAVSSSQGFSVASHSDSNSDSDSQASLQVDQQRKSTRYAYVGMHYEGTPRDDEYLLGLRVLIKSIRLTGSTMDFVVLISNNVRESTKARLLADGAVLQEISNLENPYGDARAAGRRNKYNKRFVYSFNKLYLWNMTQYERVIYLDSDNVALDRNVDDLFLCGRFCVVFMNPVLFHTGLMVVRPNRDMFQSLHHALYEEEAFSHDGADQGFLAAQFDIEYAPLFSYNLIHRKKEEYRQKQLLQKAAGNAASEQLKDEEIPIELLDPYEEDAMRMPLGYNMNHMYFYPFFDWHWYRNRPGEIYNEDDVPAYTLAYPSAAWLKPWFWYPVFFFHLYFRWQTFRDHLEGVSFTSTVIESVILSALLLYALRLVFRLVALSSSFDRLRLYFHRMISVSPFFFGYFFGFVWLLVSFLFLMKFILPFFLPWWYGFPLFVLFDFHLVYYGFCFFCMMLTPRRVSAQAYSTLHSHSALTSGFASTNTYLLMLGMELSFGIMFLGPWAWSGFIFKIVAMVAAGALWIVGQAHMFRRAAEKLVPMHHRNFLESD